MIRNKTEDCFNISFPFTISKGKGVQRGFNKLQP